MMLRRQPVLAGWFSTPTAIGGGAAAGPAAIDIEAPELSQCTTGAQTALDAPPEPTVDHCPSFSTFARRRPGFF